MGWLKKVVSAPAKIVKSVSSTVSKGTSTITGSALDATKKLYRTIGPVTKTLPIISGSTLSSLVAGTTIASKTIADVQSFKPTAVPSDNGAQMQPMPAHALPVSTQGPLTSDQAAATAPKWHERPEVRAAGLAVLGLLSLKAITS